MKKVYLILIASVLFFNCFDLFDPTFWKDGDYKLSSNPAFPDCVSLTNNNFVLLNCVKSIASDQNYIIATDEKNDSIQYWIIKKTENKYNQELKGPFSYKQFLETKKSLLIPGLEFDKNF